MGSDEEAKHVLFDWSMAELVEHYLQDERPQAAYLGQGVTGRTPAPSMRARLPSLLWAECRASGAMCRAAWAWSRSISVTRHGRPVL